jgi:large subunit ribosomal protein L29
MKVDELRVLEADELNVRLKSARRELYELRFKHAVGQLENSSQISKVRHDLARIMTVLRERDFGIVATPPQDVVTSPLAGEVAPQGAGGGVDAAEAAEELPAKPKRTRKKTEETK